MSINNEVNIFPGFTALHYSFYIEGLLRVKETQNIHFGNSDFPLRMISYLAFEYKGKRYVIDAMDTSHIDEPALQWCDLCGKVNYSQDEIKNKYKDKVIPIGPSFAVRIWPLAKSISLAFRNLIKSKLKSRYYRMVLSSYFHQSSSRLSEEEYKPNQAKGNYVFSLHSFREQSPEANEYRRKFMECVTSNNDLRFEGGFFSRNPIRDPKFLKFQIRKTYKISDYLEKLENSLLIFNTPAVKDCLGWKLAESLALGKAIISTPLLREMPEELIHGVHIHIVDGTRESIMKAIKKINIDASYRLMLENNARNYYVNHLKPEKIIKKLINVA